MSRIAQFRAPVWTLCQRSVVGVTALLVCGLVNDWSQAQEVAAPACALHPDEPSNVVVVPGFPEQRLYIYRKSPLLCSGTGPEACVPTAYVVTGDTLLASSSCDGWSYVRYNGKTATIGWAASTALGIASGAPSPQPPSPDASKLREAVDPVCLVAQRLLNSELKDPDFGRQPLLPSDLRNMVSTSNLPGHQQAELSVWDGATWDVTIQGRQLKAVTYGSGGTCHDDNLELWDKALSRRFSVAGSNADADDNGGDGYSSEDIVALAGKPYFAHYSRSARTVTITSFGRSLASTELCEISQVGARHEAVRVDRDPALCAAALHGGISGAPIYDVEPYIVAPEALGFGQKGIEAIAGPMPITIVSRGRVDIDNTGRVSDVGMIEYEDGTASAGCGHDVDTSVPIKLNGDGMPEPGSQFNLEAIEHAGAGEDSRLLEYRGKTYFETRSRPDSDEVPSDVIWELSRQGRQKICEFVPVHYVSVP